MSNNLFAKKLILAPALTACMVLAAPVSAQNAGDIPKVTNTGKCESQDNGSGKCDVSGANYSGDKITGWYRHMRAVGADFTYAKIGPGAFDDANLSNADFSDAKITGMSVHSANLTGANLSGSSLRDAALDSVNLTNANLNGARVDNWDTYFPLVTLCNTTLPDGSKSNRDC
ncbi:pentapeptide repeat-containing protein [Cohaesibacter celericrescens]|uniref:Pentapeptide repeat-containing protein n=1 Tax=Cohaesibacter celericrescens TaxID=2067669 RepID=A0A2N5XQW2_9HYPH|nr:pentapeptide repeat-containing protein [Cohaesibacter celericrescens]PLW76893.1 hypothetical protein C0081_12625 [Cohaesibacter celericrescens]